MHEETKGPDVEEEQADEVDQDSATLPLLPQQCRVQGEVTVVTQLHQKQQQQQTTASTDGAGQKTSVQHKAWFGSADQPEHRRSVRRESRDKDEDGCSICSEPCDAHGRHQMVLLNCNHPLCQHCLDGILRRAADASRVQCPFCRQNTPSLHWEIQRLQDEMFANGVYDPASVLPDPAEPCESRPASASHLAVELPSRSLSEPTGCGGCLCPACAVNLMRRIRQPCHRGYLALCSCLFLMVMCGAVLVV